MPAFSVFEETSLSEIHPSGWLRRYLAQQRDGLTGHPEKAGYPFDCAWWGAGDWAQPAKPGYPTRYWGPYEQTGYWIDGALRCGLLLHDAALTLKASQSLDYVLSHADSDGYLGPRFMKTGERLSRWPHVVFFRALMAYYSANKDERILPALKRHYRPGAYTYCDEREVCNIEPMLWLFDRLGDRRLLRQAVEAFEGFNRACRGADMTIDVLASDKRASVHAVTFNEIAKLGAIVYMHTGEQRYLDAAVNGYRKLDRDQMLIDGIPSCVEELSGKDPLDGHETCNIADYTWSVGYLLLATGKAEYADKIERACFNAAPGAVTSDFKALQYFSYPNQVLATAASNHTLFFRGYPWMSYRPNPGTECCTGNVHRIMPNFAARMWLRDRQGGVVAALYGPGAFIGQVGQPAQTVTISEETDYPFAETITFTVHTPTAVEFPFSFRIPEWCRRPQALLNGKPLHEPLLPGTFVTVRRRFADRDRLSLTLPMELRLSHWPMGGIGIERGPLAFALRIREDWRVVDRSKDERDAEYRPVDSVRWTADFPAWDLLPASPWNYALALDEHNLEDHVEIVHKPMSPDPWSIDRAPIELRVPARRVVGWGIEASTSVISTHSNATKTGCVTEPIHGDFALTPQLPDPATLAGRLSPDVETVTLAPYGCTRLRVAVFPVARS